MSKLKGHTPGEFALSHLNVFYLRDDESGHIDIDEATMRDLRAACEADAKERQAEVDAARRHSEID